MNQQATFSKLQDYDNELNDLLENSILSRTWRAAIALAWSFFIAFEIFIGTNTINHHHDHYYYYHIVKVVIDYTVKILYVRTVIEITVHGITILIIVA